MIVEGPFSGVGSWELGTGTWCHSLLPTPRSQIRTFDLRP